jgi:hyperosmotically inducible periplasmic protein
MAAVVVVVIYLPLYASEIDVRIKSSAMESYAFKTDLKNDDIKIQSEDGIVTLTGTVTEEFHRLLAQETIAELPGVKSVDNRLELKGEGAAKNSDVWIKTRAKTALLFNWNVSASKTEVDVKDGIVTLHGEVVSEAQKELTAQYVKDVEGVKNVKNEMTVSNTSEIPDRSVGEYIDDISITVQVKVLLLFHPSTSALNTKVWANGAMVVLSGKARNIVEKDMVTELARDVNGVKSVVNNMTIDESLSTSN